MTSKTRHQDDLKNKDNLNMTSKIRMTYYKLNNKDSLKNEGKFKMKMT